MQAWDSAPMASALMLNRSDALQKLSCENAEARGKTNSIQSAGIGILEYKGMGVERPCHTANVIAVLRRCSSSHRCKVIQLVH